MPGSNHRSGDIGDVAEKVNFRAHRSGEYSGRRFARKHGKGKYAQRIYEKEVLRLCREYCLHHFSGWDRVGGQIKDSWQNGFDKGWLKSPQEEEVVSQ